MKEMLKAIKLTDEELDKTTGGETKQFCPDQCDGELVGSCDKTRYICPFTYKK